MVQEWNIALVGGAAAGFAVDVSLFPLDTIKTRLQAKQGFIKAGGFKGIYRGIGPAALGSAPGAAVFFTFYDTSKKFLYNRKPVKDWSEYDLCVHHMMAASIGEVGACTVRVPVEVIKQRAQTHAHMNSWQILKTTLKSENIFGLYRGYTTTVMREIPFSLIQFPLWEFMKNYLKKRSKDGVIAPWKGAFCGMLAGGTAAGLTTPIDVAKTRIMIAEKTDIEAKGNMFSIIKDIYKTQGFKGLYAGALPRIMWISIGGFIFLGTYDFVTSTLKR